MHRLFVKCWNGLQFRCGASLLISPLAIPSTVSFCPRYPTPPPDTVPAPSERLPATLAASEGPTTMSASLPVPKSFGLTYDPPSITVVYALDEKLRARKPHSPPCPHHHAQHTVAGLLLRRQAHDARA